MEDVTLADLQCFANEMNGQVLLTRGQSLRFRLRVTQDGFEYTPESTGRSRLQRWRYIERLLARYNATQSLELGNFQDLTANGSYFLALLGGYVERRQMVPG